MRRTSLARGAESRLLLLDTHVWLWQMEGNSTLARQTREAVEQAAAEGGLRLSVMSAWEIALLVSRRRIQLSKPVASWISESLVLPGPSLEPLSPQIAIESRHLPGGFRSDPADEIIIATARVLGAALMTRDRRILDYAAAGYLTAVPA